MKTNKLLCNAVLGAFAVLLVAATFGCYKEKITEKTVVETRTDTLYVAGDTVVITKPGGTGDTIYLPGTPDTIIITTPADTIYLPGTPDTIIIVTPPDTVYLRTDAIYLAGLWWDKYNLPGGHYKFDDAQAAAASVNKRLPTQAEFTQLAALPNVWDVNGLWFAESVANLKNPEKSIFLPAAGYLNTAGTHNGNNTQGNYWSSTQVNTTNAYNLEFNITSNNPSRSDLKTSSRTVRCVSQ